MPTSTWLKHDFSGTFFFIHGFSGDSGVGTGVMFKNLTFWQTFGNGGDHAGITIKAQGTGDMQYPSWIRIEDCNFEKKEPSWPPRCWPWSARWSGCAMAWRGLSPTWL
jgi:hypothetical protein